MHHLQAAGDARGERGARAAHRLYRDRPALFLLVWFAWGFLFFSASRNKLPGYLLPLLPAVAALMGIALSETARARILLAACGLLFFIAPPLIEVLPQALVSGISHVSLHFTLWGILGCSALTVGCALLDIGCRLLSWIHDIQQTSRGKFDRRQRATVGFTSARLDGYWLRCSLPTRLRA